MKVHINVSVADMCDYIWDSVLMEIDAGRNRELLEPDFHFVYDDEGRVTGMDITTEVYKAEE